MDAFFAWCVGPAAARCVIPIPSGLDTEGPALGHLRAARAAVARGDLDEALRRFDEAILLDPSCAVAHLGRTITLAALGRADEASRSLQASFEATPGPDLAHQFSRLAAREGNSALAMDLLGVAMETRPELSERVLDDPAYQGLRDHPRLLAMMGRL